MITKTYNLFFNNNIEKHQSAQAKPSRRWKKISLVAVSALAVCAVGVLVKCLRDRPVSVYPESSISGQLDFQLKSPKGTRGESLSTQLLNDSIFNISNVAQSQICPAETSLSYFVNGSYLLGSSLTPMEDSDEKSDSAWMREYQSILRFFLEGEKKAPIHHHFGNITEELPSHCPALNYIDTSLSLTLPAPWVDEVNIALKKPNIKLIETGVSASYLIMNAENQPMAIFKPSSQAGGAVNNPKGFDKLNFGKTNNAAINEYGARLVSGNDLGVPDIYLVKMMLNGEIEQGSLQKYVPNEGSASVFFADQMKLILKHAGIDEIKKIDELSFSDGMKIRDLLSSPEKLWKFALASQPVLQELMRKLDPAEIQKIGILDLLIQNYDRINSENILFTNTPRGHKLIPIDHNLAFPETIKGFSLPPVWLEHPSAFHLLNPKVVQFIKKMDIEKLKTQLTEIGMAEGQIFHFELMHLFVKMATEANFSLFEMGKMLSINNYKTATSPLAALILDTNARLTAKDRESNVYEKYKPLFESLLSIKIAEMKEEIARQGASTQIREVYLARRPEILANFSNFQETYSTLLRRMEGLTVQPYCHFIDKDRETLYLQQKATAANPIKV